MSWWGRRAGVVCTGVLSSALFMLGACDTDNRLLESQLLDSQSLRAVQAREFVFEASTVWYPDSIRTDEDALLVMGRYTDQVFGQVEAVAYAALRERNTAQDIAADVMLDSMQLSFQVDRIYGKAGAFLDFSVYALTEELKRDSIYYSTDQASYAQAMPALQVQERVELEAGETYTWKVDATWQEAYKEKITVNSSDKPFYGLAFVSGPMQDAVLSLRAVLTTLTLFYKGTAEDAEEPAQIMKVYDLGNARHNYLAADRMGSVLAGLVDGQPTAFEDFSYVQGGLGVFSVIDIDLERMRDTLGSSGILNEALLTVGPVQDRRSGDTHIALPTSTRWSALPDQDEHISASDALRNVVNADYGRLTNVLSRAVFPLDEDTYAGNIAITLREALSSDATHVRWVLFPSDVNHVSPIVIPSGSIRLKIFYSE